MSRLYVLLAALCFGTTGTAQALGPDGIDPVVVGAARIACGGALLVIFALAVRRVAGPRWAGSPTAPAGPAAGGGERHGRAWPPGGSPCGRRAGGRVGARGRARGTR